MGWISKTAGFFGGALKLGLGALVVGSGTIIADEEIFDGQGRKKLKTYADKVIRDGVDVKNETDIYGERQRKNAELQSWGSGILSGIAGFFRLIGQFIPSANKAADYFAKKAQGVNSDAMQATRDFSDVVAKTKAELAGEVPAVEGSDPSTRVTIPGPTSVTSGKADFFSVAGSFSYGLETSLVNMGTGITSLVSGTYEAATTDKSWGASISDDFNAQQSYVLGGLEGIHGKPTIDTPIENFFNVTGNASGYLIPATALIKGAGSIVSGLANLAPKALPEVQPALALALK